MYRVVNSVFPIGFSMNALKQCLEELTMFCNGSIFIEQVETPMGSALILSDERIDDAEVIYERINDPG